MNEQKKGIGRPTTDRGRAIRQLARLADCTAQTVYGYVKDGKASSPKRQLIARLVVELGYEKLFKEGAAQ